MSMKKKDPFTEKYKNDPPPSFNERLTSRNNQLLRSMTRMKLRAASSTSPPSQSGSSTDDRTKSEIDYDEILAKAAAGAAATNASVTDTATCDTTESTERTKTPEPTDQELEAANKHFIISQRRSTVGGTWSGNSIQ